jgi:hypothetical protein
VPWWGEANADVTLQRIIVHVIYDVSRHAGHADILREQYDGEVGLRQAGTNIPDGYDWPSYRAKLTDLAQRFG